MSNAALIVSSGHSVIVDAVFARDEERRHAENVARRRA
jgi:predicted kinase